MMTSNLFKLCLIFILTRCLDADKIKIREVESMWTQGPFHTTGEYTCGHIADFFVSTLVGSESIPQLVLANYYNRSG